MVNRKASNIISPSSNILSPYKGSAAMTQGQFLFSEVRITAGLLLDGLGDSEIIDKIASENLYQYPTEKSLKKIARCCLKRLHCLQDDEGRRSERRSSSELGRKSAWNDELEGQGQENERPNLIAAIVNQPSDVAKQICLYAMMKQYRLVWDFMITVIGNKYEKLDYSFGRIDVNSFFMRLEEQDDNVASWSDNTISKLKQVLVKTLVENEYLDSPGADHLNPVLISPILEKAIREEGRTEALPAFNCLG